jgi:predicted HD superfamily hydrolase involved in NAD metabolism
MNQNANIRKIRNAMEKKLDEKRYEHTLGVAYTAANLAAIYGANIKDAEIAGLLHDCAKCIEDEKKLSICMKHNITINSIEEKTPFLLHGKVGGFLAMRKYGIMDQNIINAIINHTTGRPNMTLLEKIIYVADYIEPNRKSLPNLNNIRKLAYEDLDKALLCILEDTLQYLNSTKEDIDPLTQKTYEYYYDKLIKSK